MGWRIRPRGALAVSLVCGVACGAPTSALAHPPTPLQQTKAAQALIGKIPHSRFARGRRLAMLSYARRAVKLAHGKHACKALAATDAFLNGLGTPTTWHRSHVPTRLVREPLHLLKHVERRLLRRAGVRCGRGAGTKPLKPHTGGSGSPSVQPPDTDPEQGEGEDHPIPLGKFMPVKSIGGTSALGPDPHGGSQPNAAGDPLARIASGPFSFFQNSDVGVPPRQASPQEPTAAIAPAAGVVWYTGNTSDALSTDNGRTFTMFNPSNVLPDQGLPFCCDQVVSYSPSYNLFVWVSQYWCNKSCLVSDGGNPPRNVCRNDGVFNRIRIAVATPQALKANATNPGAAWTYWDVTPSTIGAGANAWFDRSDMSVNPVNFNWGVDIICGNAGNLQGRISLAQLAARGSVTLNYATIGGQRTVAQGLGTTTTYFTGASSLSQAEIWSWAPYSGTLFRHQINHSSVPIFNNAINGTDHNNWYDRYGIFPGEVESATISGNTLYEAQGTGRAYCTASCSSMSPTLHQVFNEPSIFISKYNLNTWTNAGERWLWNPTLAFGWPALQTDSAGDVGIAFRSSADNQNAQPVAGFLTPAEQFFYADPAGQPYETGDYYSLRPGRTNQSFVMTSQTMQNDPGGAAMHWFYVEYGLGTPPYVSPPNVHITAPANLASFTQGASVPYSASVSDPIDGTLPAGAIRWTEDGSQIGTGPSISHVENTPGTHVISVTATNGDGKSASDSITIRVQAPAGPLSAAIAAPADGSQFTATQQGNQFCASVQFRSTNNGAAGVPVTFSWTDSVDQGIPQQVSTQQSPLLPLCLVGTDGQTTHDLTLTVSDGTHTAVATVRVRINTPIG